jgi:hypothetical protein
MSHAISPDAPAVLTCWKDIAQYFGKGVRTVQRWEQCMGLPIRRPAGMVHKGPKSAVIAYSHDLDVWLLSRWSLRPGENKAETSGVVLNRQILCREIANGVQVARELRQQMQALRKEHRDLMHELESGLHSITLNCQRWSNWN